MSKKVTAKTEDKKVETNKTTSTKPAKATTKATKKPAAKKVSEAEKIAEISKSTAIEVAQIHADAAIKQAEIARDAAKSELKEVGECICPSSIEYVCGTDPVESCDKGINEVILEDAKREPKLETKKPNWFARTWNKIFG